MRVQALPLGWVSQRPYFAITIKDILTPEECQSLVQRSEEWGYEMALINIGGGRQQMMADRRNSDRCIMDDAALAEVIWNRIVTVCNELDSKSMAELNIDQLLLQHGRGWHAVGLNERLRFLRYRPGTYFKPHYDGCYVRGGEAGEDRRGEQSFITCQVYLNEGCVGGETRFMSEYNDQEAYGVVPKMGSVLLFQHDLLHEGAPVTKGEKFVIRTDVMYTSKGTGHEYSHSSIPGPPSTGGRSDSFMSDEGT